MVFVLLAGGVFTLVLAFASVAGRLLGLPFGRVRTLLAGLLAFLVAGPLFRAMAGSVDPDDDRLAPLWFLLLGAAVAVLAGMVFLALAEVLVPTGSVPGPLELVRGLRSRTARARRYSQIVRIAIRHGLGPYLRGRGRPGGAGGAGGRARLARSLREALDDGGVTFVKLGQVLSTRRDLLPAEFADELRGLQDRVAPAEWAQVEAVLTRELGAPVDEVFAEFDRTPLAAASIAQVHAARLRTGERVVVKVRRPGIASVVERDLDIVARLARTLEQRTRWGRSLGARELAAGFAQAVREELDFRVEAANMAAVRQGGSGGDAVVFPAPHEPLCTSAVLVMERLDGTPLADVPAGERPELARTLFDCLLRQILVEGVFHADPHPGNVLVLGDGRLGLLDFGSVGRLDGALRDSLRRLLLALDRGDPLGVGDALLEVAPGPEGPGEQALERALGRFMARHLAPGSVPGVRMFTDLFRVVAEHRLAIPPEVAAVFRALATVEGTLARLSPGFDIVAEARRFGAAYVTEGLDVRDAVQKELGALLPMLRRLPRRVERIAGAVESGRLSVNVRLFADERDRRHVTGLLHQVLLTVLGATAGIMAVLLLGTAGGPPLTGTTSLYQFLGYCLLVISSVLVLRVLVIIFRRVE
ncbi:ABC1 kinase family protein [Bailinhaonella thermotolerans]|uniref:AarF/ABC1/UbiB kinase family protein n=1 Tax=Bailinhaonella thermotolerans TaxID=1070861 RepID=A0A3A4AZW5_9ACTN|nr:AarF/UbiB family protein [Bailinhaonella thermotolerans]RJL34673.1 AarF/ABC1/UbiB kinase family protein [Bailinhaonella thermotolerans]